MIESKSCQFGVQEQNAEVTVHVTVTCYVIHVTWCLFRIVYCLFYHVHNVISIA